MCCPGDHESAPDTNGRWYPLASHADLIAGLPHGFQVDGRRVVLCATREGLYALEDTCTHAEAHMSEGRLRGCRLVCPLHGASFDVRDGRVLGGPAHRPLACFPVRVVEGRVEVLL
ncbi:MAG: hypothetical protein H6R27_723 [Proteobacteria bacterium]|nr:hypothetical protein [Pseudomonadota bacterium]